MTLRVLHVWDRYVGSRRRDLQWELLRREEVRSLQCVRDLETTGVEPSKETMYMELARTGDHASVVHRARERLARRLSWRRYRRFVEQHVERFTADVLHAHFGTTGWEMTRLAERLRLPLVVSFYGVDVSQAVRERVWQRRYVSMFRTATFLIVLCQAAADRLAALGCPPEKLRIWNHPLDLEAYAYRSKSPATPVRLITGARFVEKKGYPVLLRALAALLDNGRDVSLTAVGYGPMRSAIDKEAASLGLCDRFRIIDTTGVSHFDALYSDLLAEHDIFVLPSTTASSGDDEGGPALSLVLAQAVGLPVVCTPFAGSERSVVDNETGLICRQDDAGSLAERIAWLIDRPETGMKLAGAANTLVRGSFDLRSQVDELVSFYLEATEQPGPEHRDERG